MFYLSVVICTLSRTKQLEEALLSLSRQTFDNTQYETIVVDNSPNKSAEDLVRRHVEMISNLSYTHEPILGLSHARNRGIEVSQGEWVVFLDDDAEPESYWLENLSKCISSIPCLGVVGGKVLPVWLETPPKWLSKELYPSLSVCDYGTGEDFRKLDFPTEAPVGANIAYPKKLLSQFGKFNPRFGRQGSLLLSGEETELNHRFYQAGLPIWYCPNAIVYHHIPKERMTKSFFRRRNYWSGRTWALLQFERFGGVNLRRNLLERFLYGITIGIARSFAFSVLHRNIFLFEFILYEWFGYIVQGIQINFKKKD